MLSAYVPYGYCNNSFVFMVTTSDGEFISATLHVMCDVIVIADTMFSYVLHLQCRIKPDLGDYIDITLTAHNIY